MNLKQNFGTVNTDIRNSEIKYIVIHYTAGSSSVAGCANSAAQYVKNGHSGASADYYIDNETVVQYNEDIRGRYTWHCGGAIYTNVGPNCRMGKYSPSDKPSNSNSIGIECCSGSTDTRYVKFANHESWYFNDRVVNNTIELVLYLMKEYNIDSDHIIRHYDVTGKRCPGIKGWNDAPMVDNNGKETTTNNTDEKWQEFLSKIKTGDITPSLSESTATCGYYSHPLGSAAQSLSNGTAESSEIPHTSDEIDSVYMNSSIDFGSGASIKANSPVYSMTDGTIYNVTISTDENNQGISLYVQTDRIDSSGNKVCIKYSRLGGVADKIANVLGIPNGNISLNDLSNITPNLSSTIQMKMGEQIGYTNDFGDNTSNLRISFIYKDKDTNEELLPENYPHISESKNSKITLEKIESGLTRVLCNGEIVGGKNGMVTTLNGTSGKYQTYPYLSYITCQQQSIYVSNGHGSGPKVVGKIEMLPKNKILYGENLNQEALDFYLNGIMSESWIGPMPNTTEDVNNNAGLRMATTLCKNELNFDFFSGVGYAKLMRAKMIGEKHTGNNMEQWYRGLNRYQFASPDYWRNHTFSNSDDIVLYAQYVYLNLRYPEIYGAEYFSGTNEFFDTIVYSLQQIPIYNLSPMNYYPHAFYVNFDVRNNKSCGESGGAGHYLMYRQKKGDMAYFNSAIQ